MTIQISDKDLETVKSILANLIPEKEVWAFGSRVSGKARQFSDLDLVIIGKKPLDLDTTITLKEAFSHSDLPFKIDIVDWATIDDSFKKIIKENFVVLS